MCRYNFPRSCNYLLILMVLLSILTVCLPQLATAANPELIGTSIIADVAEASIPRVVWISATYETPAKTFSFNNLPKNVQPAKGIGTGFFFDAQGYILTNAHVVSDAQSLEVTLNAAKKPLPAKLIGIDRDLDVAVIKVELSQKLPYLVLGDSERTRIGDFVIAIGNPYGLDHTVTQGIISAKGRPLNASDNLGRDLQFYENMIQTDAAINPGNSGGPLLNLKGEVIGINTLVNAEGQGLGFAIPINSVKEILNELMTKGKVSRPWIGVQMVDLKLNQYQDPQLPWHYRYRWSFDQAIAKLTG